MDNGQVNQNTGNEVEKSPAFFTTGAGTQPESINPDKDESLNTSNFSGQSEHNFGKVGNIAINGELIPRPESEQINISASEVEFDAPEMPQNPFELISETQPVSEDTTKVENTTNLSALKTGKPSIIRKTIEDNIIHPYRNNEISPADVVNLRSAAHEAYQKEETV